MCPSIILNPPDNAPDHVDRSRPLTYGWASCRLTSKMCHRSRKMTRPGIAAKSQSRSPCHFSV